MAIDHIRYDVLAQGALRGVVRTVLADTAKKGLPGEHHFKVTFNTGAAGVRLSDRMRAQYPQEMTIVLQHQFWDLVVSEEGFEVGLSFSGIPERVVVPFAAVTAFYDPAVQFGFQFEAIEGVAGDLQVGERSDASMDRSAESKLEPLPVSSEPAPASPAPGTGADNRGGEVVRLDRFRKK